MTMVWLIMMMIKLTGKCHDSLADDDNIVDGYDQDDDSEDCDDDDDEVRQIQISRELVMVGQMLMMMVGLMVMRMLVVLVLNCQGSAKNSIWTKESDNFFVALQFSLSVPS